MLDTLSKSRTRSVVRVQAPLINGKTLAIRLSPFAENPSLWSVRIGHRRLVTTTETIFDLVRMVDEFRLHGVDLSEVARANWLRQLLYELKAVGLSALTVKGWAA